MEIKSSARFVRIAPQKVRLVGDMIKGKLFDDALNILSMTNKKAAGIVLKLLKAGAANAEAKEEIDIDSLYVKNVLVDQGPTLKRFRPRARGRATLIKKRTAHITVVFEETF